MAKLNYELNDRVIYFDCSLTVSEEGKKMVDRVKEISELDDVIKFLSENTKKTDYTFYKYLDVLFTYDITFGAKRLFIYNNPNLIDS